MIFLQHDKCAAFEAKITQLEKQLEAANKILAMVENNSKMPHKHQDYFERLCCLTERANEYYEKYGR